MSFFQELDSVRAKNKQLEAEKLSKLPPDTAKEIKALQDKIVNMLNTSLR